MTSQRVIGLLASFTSPATVLKAAESLRDAGYKRFEVYSPFPIHGMDRAMGINDSPLGWIVVVCGAIGLSGALLLQWWVSVEAYAIVTSGKPLFSFQAFVPICFELMVLLSGFGAVFGMFALNKLPQLYHPLFRKKSFLKVTSHGFFVSVDSDDPRYSQVETADLLRSIGSVGIETIED